VPESVNVPPLSFCKLPPPLIPPERTPSDVAAILKLFVSNRLLLIVSKGLTVPVALRIIVGVVAPLLINSKRLPEIVTVGWVPLLSPAYVKLSIFSLKSPAMSLFVKTVTLAATVALKVSVVSVALTGVALQFVPALH
jgi:hypothetical protein